MMFNTKQGVFGPGGHGGGIFQTTVAGLGGFDPFTGVPGVCWNQAGFSNCSTAANQSANKLLHSLYKNGDISFGPGSVQWKESFNKMWNEGLQKCMKDYCGVAQQSRTASSATTEEMVDLPLGQIHSGTKAIQMDANTVLPGMGMALLKVDGVLGPNTCGAIQAIIKAGTIQGWVMPKACRGVSTIPTSSNPPTPAKLPPITTDPAEVYAASMAPSSNKKLLVMGLGALAVVGGYIVWKKSR